jgi:hypothetical protein
MTIKYSSIPILRPSKIYPNWDFGFENKPSGNPALHILFSERVEICDPISRSYRPLVKHFHPGDENYEFDLSRVKVEAGQKPIHSNTLRPTFVQGPML